jgi:zinc transport system substrate-binding protein
MACKPIFANAFALAITTKGGYAMNRKSIWTMLTTLWIGLALAVLPSAGEAGATRQTVLVSTFPIYQIVRNVTQSRDGVKVDLMLPGQLGCPHDYALTPQDMQKLAKADMLVVNGLGMEEFLGAPVKKANANINVIDSSMGIKETLDYSEEHHHGNDHGHDHSEAGHHAEDPEHDHDAHDHDQEHHHYGHDPAR